MENIKIIDNFLNESQLEEVLKYIKLYDFKYGHKSGFADTKINTFFSHHISDTFFTEIIKEEIEKNFNKKFNIERHYVHIQTFGLDGCYHIDSSNSRGMTFCLYITDIGDKLMDNAGGEFLIKIQNESFIISVDALMNRGILFPGNYYHKGMAYNRSFENARICITWKLEELP
jgi:hypothetical protein